MHARVRLSAHAREGRWVETETCTETESRPVTKGKRDAGELPRRRTGRPRARSSAVESSFPDPAAPTRLPEAGAESRPTARRPGLASRRSLGSSPCSSLAQGQGPSKR